MKNTLLRSIAFLSFVSCVVESHAAVITFTDTLPATNVILANSTPSAAGNIQVRNLGGVTLGNNRWVGSGFKAPTNTTLDKVTFFIYNDLVNAPALGAAMTFSIVSLTTQTGSPSAPFTPLYSESATVPSTYSAENYITFDLASAFALTANSFYGVMMSFDSGASNRGINLAQSANATGGTGNLGDLFYTADVGATYTNTAAPLNFVLQTVPEPATWGLLAFSLTTITVLRRRRA